jgi:hypothetical protein
MACYTLIEQIEDSAINRRARRALGLSEEGYLSSYDIRRVKQEAGVIKARDQILKLNPKALIKRRGNELEVSVMVN